MERAKVVAEVGPINALPIGQMLTQRSHGKIDNMTTGMVTATTNGLGLDTLLLHMTKRNLEDEELEFVEDEDLATALLAMAECDNDETPTEGLDELASAAQQLFVGYMAAGTHKGKSKGKGKPSGKGKNNKGKGKHVFRTQTPQLRTESST